MSLNSLRPWLWLAFLAMGGCNFSVDSQVTKAHQNSKDADSGAGTRDPGSCAGLGGLRLECMDGGIDTGGGTGDDDESGSTAGDGSGSTAGDTAGDGSGSTAGGAPPRVSEGCPCDSDAQCSSDQYCSKVDQAWIRPVTLAATRTESARGRPRAIASKVT